MNFAHFCEFWCFSLGKQARFTLNFCSGKPLQKVHEPTFLWFGLSGPLLNIAKIGSPDIYRNQIISEAMVPIALISRSAVVGHWVRKGLFI